MTTRDAFESGMKMTLIRSVGICYDKCIQPSNEPDLSTFEKSCLGKCFDKFHAISQKNLHGISDALTDKSKQKSEYDENFWEWSYIQYYRIFFNTLIIIKKKIKMIYFV